MMMFLDRVYVFAFLVQRNKNTDKTDAPEYIDKFLFFVIDVFI